MSFATFVSTHCPRTYGPPVSVSVLKKHKPFKVGDTIRVCANPENNQTVAGLMGMQFTIKHIEGSKVWFNETVVYLFINEIEHV